MTPLKVAGNAFTLASVYLARRNSVHTWWTGMIAVSLYGVLFFGVKLYAADVVLQVFFFGTCVAGWWQWTRGGAGGSGLPVSALTGRQRIGATAAVVSAALFFGTLSSAGSPTPRSRTPTRTSWAGASSPNSS